MQNRLLSKSGLHIKSFFFFYFCIAIGHWIGVLRFYGGEDIAAAVQLSGHGMSSIPNGDLPYSSPLLGWTIAFLYRTLPGVEHYSLFLLFCNSIALTAFARGCGFDWRLSARSISFALLASAFILTCAWNIQFTMVSSALALGSLCLFPKALRGSLFDLIFLALLAFTASLLRWESALLIGVVAAPCLSFLAAFFGKELNRGRIVLVAGTFIGVVATGVITNDLTRSEDSKEIKLLVRATLPLRDYGRIYKDESNLFQSVNWTLNDYRLFMSNFSPDREVVTHAILEKLKTDSRAGQRKGLKWTATRIYWAAKDTHLEISRISEDPRAYAPLGLLILIASFWSRRDWFPAVISLVILSVCTLGVLSLLNQFMKPPPPRVYLPLLFSFPLLGLFFTKDSECFAFQSGRKLLRAVATSFILLSLALAYEFDFVYQADPLSCAGITIPNPRNVLRSLKKDDVYVAPMWGDPYRVFTVHKDFINYSAITYDLPNYNRILDPSISEKLVPFNSACDSLMNNKRVKLIIPPYLIRPVKLHFRERHGCVVDLESIEPGVTIFTIRRVEVSLRL